MRVEILMTIGCVILFFVLLPIIKWLASLLLLLALGLFIYVIFQAPKERAKIAENPQEHFDNKEQ